MSRVTPCVLTNMCMVTDGVRVLVQNRTDRDWGGIVFPGGHVEQGESLCMSVVREIYEETGLTIESPRLVGIKNWFKKSGERYIVFLYIADRFSGELRSSDEGEVFWVEREGLTKLKLADGFEVMLPVFEDENISELCWPPADIGGGYEYL